MTCKHVVQKKAKFKQILGGKFCVFLGKHTQKWTKRAQNERGYPERDIYIYVYTKNAVKLLSGPSLAFLIVIIWAK